MGIVLSIFMLLGFIMNVLTWHADISMLLLLLLHIDIMLLFKDILSHQTILEVTVPVIIIVVYIRLLLLHPSAYSTTILVTLLGDL